MLLSNRLTYCITTLIMLLVFVAVPVMAHDGTVGNLVHDHPLLETLPAVNLNPGTGPGLDDDTDDPGEALVGPHNHHPMVTGITLKEGDNARGNMVAVAADDNDPATTEFPTFTLVVDFDRDVVGASNEDVVPDLPDLTIDSPDLTRGAALVEGDFTFTLLNVDNSVAIAASIVANRVLDDESMADATRYELVITPGTYPTGTDDANNETLRFRIRLDAADGLNGVYSLQTRGIPPDEVNAIDVPGGGNFESSIAEFTLVSELPPDPQATVNAVVESISSDGIDSKGEVRFTITFNKPLITGQTFRLGSISSIVGGRAVDFETVDSKTFKVTVAADDRTKAITVTIGEESEESDPDAVEEETAELDINVTPPIKPDSDGKLEFKITSTVALVMAGVTVDGKPNEPVEPVERTLSINDFDINTEEVEPLASGDLVKTGDNDLPDGIAVEYKLTVTPKDGVTSVTVELRAGAALYDDANDETDDLVPTPGAEGTYSPEEVKPTIAITVENLDDSGLAATPGQIDSVDGGKVTIVGADVVGLASGAEVVVGEVTIENGSMMAGSFVDGATAMFTVIPNIGATTVKVTVKADAVKDGAGNGNAVKSETFSVGPIFDIPANTIMVINKTMGMTHQYISDQPRLPINQQPPTPASDIATDIWHNMPDLEVLFSRSGGSNGGTLNLIEAHGQTDPVELPQKRDGEKQQKNSVRISEVMWAADLSLRGGVNDAEAAEQWIEVSNDTGKPVKIFLYARTGLDSAINLDDDPKAEDRVGNAYNGSVGSDSWDVPGQNGNSYTGVDFVSMHRSYVGGDNRGYVNGTSSGHWHASSREYLTAQSGNPNDGTLYNYKGSPGRRDSINLPTPGTKAGRTAIPGSSVGDNEKVVINEVANRSDMRYEWIELRNNGTAEADLRNFRISMVTAVGTETELFRFAHNEAARIPVGGVLLLVATDPRYDDDHPIAVGYNVDKGAPDQVAGLGLNVTDSPRAPARYKVVNNFGSNGLPDDGKFVIIVRSPDNHENKNEGGKGWAELANDNLKADDDDLDKITDIAGWTDQSLNKKNYPETNPVDINETHLWPLVNFGAPNVDGRNKLEVNRVHYRQHVNTNDGRRGTGITHNDKKVEQIAWRDAGYSGIGYKRTARNLIEHRGTPGYHNNTVNNKANSSVMISEVMYSTGANGQLPQWIELYNSSATKAVHLGSGWRIRIETLDTSGNALTNLLEIHFGSKGRVKYIYPQQTVLVAAGNARQAGSDFQPASVVFPENRIFNVYRDIGAGELKSGEEFKNDRYMFFNPKAFYLGLLDKDGAVVDALGNLDGDSRTNDTVTADEEFPSAVSDGVRSSIIRIYDDGVARAGMGGVVPMRSEDGVRIDKNADGEANIDDVGMGIDTKYSWIPAVNTGTEFKITIRSTWYGDEDDYGTPGHRRGLVLPVQLSFFRPTLEDGVVTVRWTTESELDNAGFNIYRSETRDGEYKQVNTELIDGAGTTGERSNYSWVDQTAKPGVVYYYQIEDVSFAGDREALAVTKLKGLISAKNKLTTTWSELKEASQ